MESVPYAEKKLDVQAKESIPANITDNQMVILLLYKNTEESLYKLRAQLAYLQSLLNTELSKEKLVKIASIYRSISKVRPPHFQFRLLRD